MANLVCFELKKKWLSPKVIYAEITWNEYENWLDFKRS